MLYLGVNGNQAARGHLVRDFYQAGLAGEENVWDFPDVDPTVMTTTADLLKQPISLIDAETRFTTALEEAGITIGHESLATAMATPEFTTSLEHATAQMARRQPRLTP